MEPRKYFVSYFWFVDEHNKGFGSIQIDCQKHFSIPDVCTVIAINLKQQHPYMPILPGVSIVYFKKLEEDETFDTNETPTNKKPTLSVVS